MIEGIGIDVVDIQRFIASLERSPNLAAKLFTANELLLTPTSLAARFAAKEALYKALSPAHGLAWHDAEVISHPNGKPDFLFRGGIADLVDGAKIHLSLSHEGTIATAMVLVER